MLAQRQDGVVVGSLSFGYEARFAGPGRESGNLIAVICRYGMVHPGERSPGGGSQVTREVQVVLVDADRTVLGELPRFEVSSPWWSDVEPVIRGAGTRFGAEIHLLRMVEVIGGEPALPRNGLVIYEAQLLGRRPTTCSRRRLTLGRIIRFVPRGRDPAGCRPWSSGRTPSSLAQGPQNK